MGEHGTSARNVKKNFIQFKYKRQPDDCPNRQRHSKEQTWSWCYLTNAGQKWHALNSECPATPKECYPKDADESVLT